MTLLLAFVLVSISVSFLCSLLEAALLSLTPSYVAQQKEERPKLYEGLSRLKTDIDRPLSAILTLNTVAHTVGATGVGAQVSILYGEAWIGAASAIMTLLILVLSEIIPKTLGATHWRALAPMLPPVLAFMIRALLPLVWLSELITSRLGRKHQAVDLRSEIAALARLGLEEKALDADEARVIANILSLHQIRVHQVMTPRTVCVTVRPGMTVAQFDAELARSPFSRYPVLDDQELPLGYVHKGEIHSAPDDARMGELMHRMEGVSERHSVETAFRAMLQDRGHIRAVYDEHGDWLGLVTLEDVLETILGEEIMDETDRVQDMRRLARERWLTRLKRNSAG